MTFISTKPTFWYCRTCLNVHVPYPLYTLGLLPMPWIPGLYHPCLDKLSTYCLYIAGFLVKSCTLVVLLHFHMRLLPWTYPIILPSSLPHLPFINPIPDFPFTQSVIDLRGITYTLNRSNHFILLSVQLYKTSYTTIRG